MELQTNNLIKTNNSCENMEKNKFIKMLNVGSEQNKNINAKTSLLESSIIPTIQTEISTQSQSQLQLQTQTQSQLQIPIILLYKEIIKDFDELNENTAKSIGKIKTNIKKMEKLIIKTGGIKKKSDSKWGFSEQRIVPKSIETFFNLGSNSKLSRTSIGKLFQDYISKNNLKGNLNLKNKIDKRIYKMNGELGKLFDLSDETINKINSSNSSNIKYPDGFNFYNYQQWIKQLYVKEFGEVQTNKNDSGIQFN